MGVPITFDVTDVKTEEHRKIVEFYAHLNEDVLKNKTFFAARRPLIVQSKYNFISYDVLDSLTGAMIQLKIPFYIKVTSNASIEYPKYLACLDVTIDQLIQFGDYTNPENEPKLAQEFTAKILSPLYNNFPNMEYRLNNTSIKFMGNIQKQIFNIIELESLASLKTKLKLLCNWMSPKQLAEDWSRMFPAECKERLDIVSEGKADYYVIVNKPPPNEYYEPNKSIVFRMEPYIDSMSYFNDWYKNKSDFLYFMDHEKFRNNTEWWIGSNFEETKKSPIKDKIISTVVSSRNEMEGHKLRLAFIKHFQQNSKYPMDIFGESNKFELANYKGSLPLRRKDAGILPYKYHFAAENSSIPGYFTEKVYDGIVGECLVFYWGGENLEDHIDSRVFIRLDLKDLSGSLAKVETAIQDDEWSKRIDIIRSEKHRIMHHYNVYARVRGLLNMKTFQFIQPSNPVLTDLNTQLIPGDHSRAAYHIPIVEQCKFRNVPFCFLSSTVKPVFMDHFCTLISALPPKWDIILFTQHPNVAANGGILYPIELNTNLPENITAGYLLNPNYNPALLEFIQQYKDKYSFEAIIRFALKLLPQIVVYMTWRPLLA